MNNKKERILLYLNILSMVAIAIFLINDEWWSLSMAWILAGIGILSNYNLYKLEQQSSGDKR